MTATAANLKSTDWIEGKFVSDEKGAVYLHTEAEKIQVVSGMQIEANVKESVIYQGVAGLRNETMYFLGRSPMFALPIGLLVGNPGRIQAK